MHTRSGGKRRMVGSVLIGLVGVVLTASSVTKFAQVPVVVAMLSGIGIAGYKVTLVAALEMASGVLLLIRSTRAVGLLMVSAFLGGAMATHLGHDEPMTAPAVLLSLVWLGAWLREPRLLWIADAAEGRGTDVNGAAVGAAPGPLVAADHGKRSGGAGMGIFEKVAPWLTRLGLVQPTVIFGLIAGRYMTHPVQAGASIGLAFNSPLAVTIVRVGFGAFPLGCAIFLLSCLVSKRRLVGLAFVSTMILVLLLVRILGMFVDGTVSENVRLVAAELGLLALTLSGLAIERGRRRMESTTA